MLPKEPSLITSSQDQPVPPGLDNLGQHLELELGLCTEAGITSGGIVGSGSDLAKVTEAESNIRGLEFAYGGCVEAKLESASETDVSPVDGETSRRLSIQEPRATLDSQTSQRLSSDPGGT